MKTFGWFLVCAWIATLAATAAAQALDNNGAAAARFAELLQGFPDRATATILPTRIHGGVKDQWQHETFWRTPEEYGDLSRSVTEIARSGSTIPEEVSRAVNFVAPALAHMQGGSPVQPGPTAVTLPPDQLRGMAGMLLRFCRSLGGRAHHPQDHYGADTLHAGCAAWKRTAAPWCGHRIKRIVPTGRYKTTSLPSPPA